MIKSLIASFLLSFSVGAKSIPIQEAIEYNDRAYINGNYNLRDNFEFDNDDFAFADYEIVFEDISSVKSYLNPISYSDGGFHFYYIYKINFNTNTPSAIALTFYYYDVYSSSSFVLNIGNGDNITDLDIDYSDLIINFRSSYSVSGDKAKLFNVFFTQEDNVLTTTYNGYYSFNNNLSSINSPFFVSGAISFGNRIFNIFTNEGDGVVGSSSTAVVGSYYDLSYDDYYMLSYGLPFDRNYVTSNNVLISGGKMTRSSYNVMASVGVFAYQHDPTYDNADWKDLLFSVMDSPIYMVSRLLNFEIFGINLYIALAGLLTIVIIVFCVRKFL